MYSTVSVRIGISWCVQYCVSKNRIVLLFLMLFYCFRMQKLVRGVASETLSQVHALAFRRYIYDNQEDEAESPLCGANDQCTARKRKE